ncbi:MAG: prepilin-type N-terminal cleavage/methylation domain-containing protein [Gammaproteobacteria bacterium]|nr:prepilin-type N-terminal cleavage/methylation domain-containing protein [Gammaproteobacteria bacterium]
MSPIQAVGSQQRRGYTLLELVIVVSVLGIIAAIVVPNTGADSDEKLRLAAEEVAGAIRFARSETLRTGEVHGLTVSQVTQKVTVKKYDVTTDPISSLGTLIHPIDKQPYDFNVNTKSTTRGVTISNSQDVFSYTGLGERRSLIFDAYGTPKWIVGSGPTTYLLSDSNIELSFKGQQRVVRVAAITGRVTVQ